MAKNLVSPSVTRYDDLSSCIMSEKTNNPILRKPSDGLTDGQTDESDFIGCCPTNVECPKRIFLRCFVYETIRLSKEFLVQS